MRIINRIKRKLSSIINDPWVKNNGEVRKEFGLFTGLIILVLNIVDMVTSYKTVFYKNYLLKIIKKDVNIKKILVYLTVKSQIMLRYMYG